MNIDSLGNSEKALLTKIFPLVSNDNNWNEYLSSVLSALKSKRYTKLISELNKDEELECNYDKILKILISDPQNIFEIEKIGDIDNFEQIRKEITDKIIKRRR